MRSIRKSWIGIVLAILFIASLFFFRGAQRYSNLFNSDNIVAKISGTPIPTTQFTRSLEMNIEQFSQMIGEKLTGDQIRTFQIHQLVLQNLVNNAIFENEFDNIKYVLDNSIIAKETKKRFPNLYLNNKINDDALNEFLRQQKLKIDDLVNIINYETRSEVFDNLIFEKNYPNELSKKISRYNEHSRNIEYLEVPYYKINLINLNKNKITKNNQELLDYFQKNKNNYMSEERRDISYIVLNKSDFKKNFEPNEYEISNYFKDNSELFILPEKRSFIQFNFNSKDEAKSFKLKINGLTKDKIIKFANENNIKFNNFNNVDKYQVLDELSNIIFSLKINEVSNIVETTLAHHIIILENITNKKEQELSEVEEEIKETLTNVQLENFYNELKLIINQQILDGLTLSELAEKNNLFIKNIKNVAQNFDKNTNLDNSVINNGFAINKDFISNIIDFDQNVSFILNVDNIYPSEQENIDVVFEILLEDFIKFKKLNLANEFFEKAKFDKNLNNINSNFNVKIKTMDIKSVSNIMPSSLVKNIFNSEINKIIFSSDEKNTYFVIVKNVNIPSESENFENINMMSEFKNAFGNEIIKTKNISFNEELINGLLSQYK